MDNGLTRFAQPNSPIVYSSASMDRKAKAFIGEIADHDVARADDFDAWLAQYDLDVFRAEALNMTDAQTQLAESFTEWYDKLVIALNDYAPLHTELCDKDGRIGFWVTAEHTKNVSKHLCERCNVYAQYKHLRVMHDQNRESIMYHTECMSIIESTIYAPGHEYEATHTDAWYDLGVDSDLW